MRFPKPFPSRRGVAIIIAVSVLAILTIVVFGLAASLRFAADNETAGQNRQTAVSLINTGLDYGLGLLAQNPAEILGKTRVIPFENAAVTIFCRQAVPGDACYAGKFLVLRPGDAILTIRVHHGKEPRITRLTQEYLVNATAGQERVVRIEERIAEKPVLAQADNPAAAPEQPAEPK